MLLRYARVKVETTASAVRRWLFRFAILVLVLAALTPTVVAAYQGRRVLAFVFLIAFLVFAGFASRLVQGGVERRAMSALRSADWDENWQATVDRLVSMNPTAANVLRMLAWTAPTDVPITLLARAGAPDDLKTAIDTLAGYEMITVADDTVRLRRPVPDEARVPGPKKRRAAAVNVARDGVTLCLYDQLPEDPFDLAAWPVYRKLLPHIAILHEHADPTTETIRAGHVYNRAGMFANQQGASTIALTYHRHAQQIFDRTVGQDHWATLSCRNATGNCYEELSEFDRADALYEQNLAESIRVLGPDHHFTVRFRINIGSTRMIAKDFDRAVPLLEESLAEAERVLGSDHRTTMLARQNLGRVYQAVGDLPRAIELHERNLADRTRVLGPDHPDTLTASIALAVDYKAAGDVDRAVEMHEQVLADRLRVFGPDHKEVLIARTNLAVTCDAAGGHARARALFEEARADSVRILGPDHPDTLERTNSVAYVYRVTGEIDRALALQDELLAHAERVLGPDHRTTQFIRRSRAKTRGIAGLEEPADPEPEPTD